MRFIPHTNDDIAAMLEAIGAASIDDLLAPVPEKLRAQAAIGLAAGLSEAQVVAELEEMARKNTGAFAAANFLGFGCYRHFAPAIVRAIIARSEFATAYTPYQAEASQGTLQAIFEFQTLITQLTGLEVANASMYDGASATAEAVLMAQRLAPVRRRVAVSRALWPDYRETLRTYLSGSETLELVEVAFDPAAGSTDLRQLTAMADDDLLCVVAGYPNAFGVVEPLGEIVEIAHRAGALAIAVTAEALALGLLKAPGDLGADIAVGEGQSFGLAQSFGGPGVGFMAARMAQVRQMPGRLVGETRDLEGRRAFCLTLATREQHIRRGRATSNICTNHSLCALAATVYLALVGRQGLRRLAERNVELAYNARERLQAAGLRLRFSGPVFNEFTLTLPGLASRLASAEASGILCGVALERWYPELRDTLLVSVTEANRATEIDRLCAVLSGDEDHGNRQASA